MELDPRRLAMLREMGLRLLPPGRDDGPAPAAAPEAEIALVAAAPPELPAEAPAGSGTDDRTAAIATLDWEALAAAVAGCRACGLCESRRNTVLGVGPARADWMVVGEAPGEQEDLRGEPFVGPAGQLLDNMLRALGLDRRRNVYIANVLKCRPPGNRNPQPDEVARCEPFLRRQVALVQPRVILAMGRFAVQSLLQSQEPIGRLRGRVHAWQGVPLVVTYHPAYLLRNLPDKAKAWADLCLAADLMDGGAP
ncbi:uracil-DNA glycosylase [Ramlibacter sp.]|uniref:uracil-DNA glycosylase n=1 Tax=Ramlibacter sp. TaxID=1917967 RepID=UPI002FC863AC